MRSRTVREGSVGILVLFGLGLLATLVMWLRGVQVGNRNYGFVVEFPSADGLQDGTPVRYRGVTVGKVKSIEASSNGVNVNIEITNEGLLIPKNVLVQANKSGLIGESVISIQPLEDLPESVLAAKPLSNNCPQIVICNGTKIKGKQGVNLDQVMEAAIKLINVYSDPVLVNNIKSMTANGAIASANVAKISQDFSTVSKTADQAIKDVSITAQNSFVSMGGSVSNSVERELKVFNNSFEKEMTGISQEAKAQMDSVSQSVTANVNELTTIAKGNLEKITNNIDQVTGQAANVTDEVGKEALKSVRSIAEVGNNLNLTAIEVKNLVSSNKDSLVNTLNSISSTAQEISGVINNLSPSIKRMQQSELIDNLEVLTANAAQASENLKNLSTIVAEPDSLLLLKETLDRANSIMQNVQKITADLEDFTGDEKVRVNLKRLINVLGNLFSSTQELKKQVQLAQVLDRVSQAENSSPSSTFIRQEEEAAKTSPSSPFIFPGQRE